MAADDNRNDDATRRRRREQRARRALERRREQAWIAETLATCRPDSPYRGATMEQLEHLLGLVVRTLLEELARPDVKQGYLNVARVVLYSQGIVCDRMEGREALHARLMKLH